ncbi:MAG: BlaI/MecI/CopY family transcriptional regulator [Coprobacillaceae bacterium]
MEYPQITEAELEIMKVIWDNHPINTNKIVDILSDTIDWSPRTIMTMLSRLEKKKVIAHNKEGRIFVYYPLVNKEQYINVETDRFINKFYDGQVTQIVSNFIENEMLNKDEINELRDLLNQAVKK